MTWFPEDVSKTGYLIDNLFYLAFTLVVITFIIVLACLLYFLYQYRARQGHQAYYTKGDSPRALGLTLALALIVFVVIDVNLAFHDHEAWEVIWRKPDSAKTLEIRVEPEQFVWNAHYAGPDGIFETADDVKIINDLHIPVHTPILVSLKSKDVIHSFFLPNFRIKQDAVPGVTTHLTFEAIKEGTFDIACAEHCGLGHYRMKGLLTAESADAFSSWLKQHSLKGAA